MSRRVLGKWSFLAVVLGGLPLLALAQGPIAEDLARWRGKLAEYRKHPEQIDKLRRDFQAFQALSDQDQQEILLFDQKLHEESPGTRARLSAVWERYVDWLERLSDKDRQRINKAPDNVARLAVIRDLRDQEWLRHQPKALRDKYAALGGPEKAEFVQQLKRQENQWTLEWMIARNFWQDLEARKVLPARLLDFNSKVVDYVNDYLKPMLSKAEEERLDKAQGQWPLYPMTLVELADKHPPALPGPNGPRTVAQLPNEVKLKLTGKTGKLSAKLLLAAEGRWPEFAVEVTRLAQKKMPPVVFQHELWPTGFKALSTPMQEFIKNKLEPVLTPAEQVKLARAEQDPSWPAYPLLLQELARAHGLHPPWYVLPPGERWELYRSPKHP